MSHENQLTRREFTLEWALAILSAATITITGCGDSNEGVTTPAPIQAGDHEGAISANHGHRAVVTAAQITAGNQLALDMRFQATHTHTLSLTQAEVASIGANQRVSKISTTDDGHNHTVTFN
jgi:hypothetical protein